MPTREQRARRLGVPVDQLPDGRGRNPASHANSPKGAAHHRWNSGRMVSDDGYVKVRVGVDHPLADPNGYAYEHLLVWCAAGRARPATLNGNGRALITQLTGFDLEDALEDLGYPELAPA